MTEIREAHFVLVHGSCHGAWCWYKVATQLRSEGHRVTALDFAACGINQKPLQEVHSCHDYFEPLLEFMTTLPLDEKVVLVGHSFGGVGLSLAMETFPEKISVAVFVTALMPGPDLSYVTISNEDLTLATMSVRPHSLQVKSDASESLIVSKEKYGSVHRVYIVADQDMILSEEVQRWMIQLNPPNDVKVIQGSDHMTMVSKPQELSSCLLTIAQHHC
uniref:AB hydrolase-1 domain-containing protein n=1 Tax=Daucus carota subsp. sativus TaxID=79200 RepID=A0A161ZQ95_DAUCS